jgi:NDP-sugar pyrophosphorylase family protein
MINASTIDSALFLAAGTGSRLKPYTLQYPKPMIPFLGLPLIYHSLDFLSQSIGTQINLIMNLHHLASVLEEFIHHHKSTMPVKSVRFSYEKEQLLDTGGALAIVEPLLNAEPHFWVCNADEVIIPKTSSFSLSKMIATHEQNKNIATLLVIKNPEVGKTFGGAWCDHNLNIMEFSKRAIDGLSGWHYIGVMLLSRKIFKYVSNPPRPENILYDVITRAIKDGQRAQVFPADLEWFETGILELFKSNERTLLNELVSNSDQVSVIRSRLSRYPQFPNIIA